MESAPSNAHTDPLSRMHKVVCSLICPTSVACHLDICDAPWLAIIELRDALHFCERNQVPVLMAEGASVVLTPIIIIPSSLQETLSR